MIWIFFSVLDDSSAEEVLDDSSVADKQEGKSNNGIYVATGVSATLGVIIIILVIAMILMMKKNNIGCFKKEENRTKEVAVDYYTVKKNDEENEEYDYDYDNDYGTEYDGEYSTRDKEYEENRQEAAYYSEDYYGDDREYVNDPL